MLPPILEVFVVFHPGDHDGEVVAEMLLERFRGNAYSGLIGGAVDVYIRSASATHDPRGAPRSLPCIEALPYGVPSPALTAIVLVAGTELAASLQEPGPWRDYVQSLVDARTADPEHVGLFNVRIAPNVFDGTKLGEITGQIQGIGDGEIGTDEFRTGVCRDLAQGITQMGDEDPDRITVFVSHTKRLSSVEQERVSELVALVREVIANTRLTEFFDAHDIQPNTDWKPAIEAVAATAALLAVRTDRYSFFANGGVRECAVGASVRLSATKQTIEGGPGGRQYRGPVGARRLRRDPFRARGRAPRGARPIDVPERVLALRIGGRDRPWPPRAPHP